MHTFIRGTLTSTRPEFNEQERQNLLAGLELLAHKAEAAQINLCYHHHMGTGIQMDKEIRWLMKETENFPQAFSLLLDTGHLYYAEEMAQHGNGQKMLDKLVADFASRIRHVHLKNIRQEILLKAQQQNQNFNGWFIVEAEQDPTRPNTASPLEYAQIAHRFVTSKIQHYSPAPVTARR